MWPRAMRNKVLPSARSDRISASSTSPRVAVPTNHGSSSQDMLPGQLGRGAFGSEWEDRIDHGSELGTVRCGGGGFW